MNTPNIDTDPSALDTPADLADRLIPLCDGSPGPRGTMGLNRSWPNAGTYEVFARLDLLLEVRSRPFGAWVLFGT